MNPQKSSWAAVAAGGTTSIAPTAMVRSINRTTTNPDASILSLSQPPKELLSVRVAFISGHIDITRAQFLEHYAAALDTAIQHGDTFILSNAAGADTLALEYLRSQKVDPSRITIYLHTPKPNGKPNATQTPPNRTRTGADIAGKHEKDGYKTQVITGYHTERDAAMTQASDYDILWVRPEAETATLYGHKYRPGRVSGTQKNKDRRAVKKKNSAT